ncbi:MAG: riboflavin synthase, partial [Pseudoalteromonas sp.]|nr:riboflavin synthase [Pseudoalteromonas sp.]
MFTGIVEATGKIALLQKKQGDLAIRIQSKNLDMSDVKLGDSIATNGVCLTVVDKHIDGFSADLSNETISLTGFAHYALGQTVNLEKAKQPVYRLGGQIVSGHVDGIAA